MAIPKIFPELPGAEVEPTPQERDAVARKIAEGYLTPKQAVKLEPVPELDAKGKPVVDEDGHVVYQENPDGSLVIEPAGYFDFSVAQDRILWALQQSISDFARRQTLRSVVSKFEGDDKGLIREAQMLSTAILTKMSDHENEPVDAPDLIGKLKADRDWRIPLVPYVERFAAHTLGQSDPTFEDFAAYFSGSRISNRLAKIREAIASKVSSALTPEDQNAIMDAVEAAISK